MRIGTRKIDGKAMRRHTDTKVQLRIKGLKASMPRIVIYSLFQNTVEPLSAEEICEQIKVANIVTVYRTLEIFEKVKLIENFGKIRKIGVPGTKRRIFYQII
jgi:Fe2+ or Zn2+ uptake regulation protein